jgi:hypothetical protein
MVSITNPAHDKTKSEFLSSPASVISFFAAASATMTPCRRTNKKPAANPAAGKGACKATEDRGVYFCQVRF